MSDRNLLAETREQVGDRKVLWVGANDTWLTWEEFCAAAKGVVYDAGYGLAEINENLLVVGEDWWLERHEYDGMEWWEEKSYPETPPERGVPKLKEEW